MRKLAVLLSWVLAVSVGSAFAEDGKFVQVKSPFANVYEYLDPKSNVLRQVARGDMLDLVYEGTSWYQVKVQDKVGWLEKRAGVVVDAPQWVTPVAIGGVIALLLATGLVVFFVLYRQRTGETE